MTRGDLATRQARKPRAARHPTTGAAQLVEVRERVEEVLTVFLHPAQRHPGERPIPQSVVRGATQSMLASASRS